MSTDRASVLLLYYDFGMQILLFAELDDNFVKNKYQPYSYFCDFFGLILFYKLGWVGFREDRCEHGPIDSRGVCTIVLDDF